MQVRSVLRLHRCGSLQRPPAQSRGQLAIRGVLVVKCQRKSAAQTISI